MRERGSLLVLLRSVSTPYYRTHRLRSVCTVAGIALGVAMLVSSFAVNRSLIASFSHTIDTIAGKAQLMIEAGEAGFSDAVPDRVQKVPGVKAAVPLVQQVVPVRGFKNTDLLVLGVDTLADNNVREFKVHGPEGKRFDSLMFVTQPDSILVTEEFAKRHRLAIGDTIDLVTPTGYRSFTVRGLLEVSGAARAFGGNVAVMDIWAAQRVFAREHRVDRVDVVLKPGANVDRVRKRLVAHLGPTFNVRRPERRNAQVAKLLLAFRMGLTTSSVVAVVVGAFIVFNTLAVAVVQRRREIGILRALGVVRSRVRRLFLAEAIVLGGIGSVMGVGLGILIAHFSLALAAESVSHTFVRIYPGVLKLSAQDWGVGIAFGVVASAVAALQPSIAATRVEPREALARRVDATGASVGRRWVAPAGVAALAGSGAALWAVVERGFVVVASFGAALAAIGLVLLAGPLTRLVLRAARRPADRLLGLEARLADDSLLANPGRTAITVAALMIALSQVVNVGGFVHSFKRSTQEWMQQTLTADLFVMATRGNPSFAVKMEGKIRNALEQVPGVDQVYGFRMYRTTYHDDLLTLITVDTKSFFGHEPLVLFDGKVDTQARRQIAEGKAALVSELFAERYDLRAGDTFTLETPEGPRKLRIAAVYLDYTTTTPMVLLDRQVFVAWWKDPRVNSFGIFLKPGVDPHDVQARIRKTLGSGRRIFVFTNEQYKGNLMHVISSLFVLTYAAELVAVIVALLGIVNTLVVSVMDRRRDIGVLRALGTRRRQVIWMIGLEALWLGLAASLLAVALGSVLSVFTVKGIIKLLSGWTLLYEFPVWVSVSVVVVALVTALVAAIYPARMAAGTSVREAIGYE